MLLLEGTQQVQRHLIIRSWARGLIKARNGFKIMIENIGGISTKAIQRKALSSTKIGGQNLDAGIGRAITNSADTIDKMLCTAIWEIVTIDGCDDDIT